MRFCGAVAVVAAAGLLAGCTTTVVGHGQAGTTPASSRANATAVPDPATLLWTRVTDSPTGISFTLPGTVTRRTRPPNGRLYESDLGGLAVSVGFGLTSGDFGTADLVAGSDWIKSQFAAVGATDARVVGLTPLTYQGHRAIQFRFTFTALRPDHPASVWLIRAIADGTALVIVQTVGFAVQPAKLLRVATAIQQRAASSVQLV